MLKNFKDSLFYIILIGGFTTLIYFILVFGKDQEAGRIIPQQVSEHSTWQQFSEVLQHNVQHPLSILLLQILTIILCARLFGSICRAIRQPAVIGEIIAGIVLGPSVVGLFFPEFSSFLFPKSSLPNLQFLSQIGLILFMFVVGMELDLKLLRNKARDAVIISHASIVVPFTLGVLLAFGIYKYHAPEGINFLSFALFIGISMSITAFPVLARIVQERGMARTRLGTIVISCAAADDVTAWCILAAVIAIVKAGSMASSFYTILLALLYVLLMLRLVQPLLKNIGRKYDNREGLSKPIVAIFFITLILSACCAEVIGIHALFGAFLAGVVMPANNKFRNIFIEKVEDVSLVLLLPLFFVFTGLRTQIGLLDSSSLWATCALIIGVAIAGKFLGSAFAARFVGQSWRDSLTIGALMNTRGLMELVVLNIGYDLGVLSPQVFAMMVLMALITTFMTAPALSLINRVFAKDIPSNSMTRHFGNLNKYSVLIAMGGPLKALPLLRVANALTKKQADDTDITLMHLTPAAEINAYNLEEFERESFRPARSESKRLGMRLNLFFKPSADISRDIIQTANQEKFDLLIMGVGRSVFRGMLWGKWIQAATHLFYPLETLKSLSDSGIAGLKGFDEKTKSLLSSLKIPVAIYDGARPEQIKRLALICVGQTDPNLIQFASRFANNGVEDVVIVQELSDSANHMTLIRNLQELERQMGRTFQIAKDDAKGKELLRQCDVILLDLMQINLIREKYAWCLQSGVPVLLMKCH